MHIIFYPVILNPFPRSHLFLPWIYWFSVLFSVLFLAKKKTQYFSCVVYVTTERGLCVNVYYIHCNTIKYIIIWMSEPASEMRQCVAACVFLAVVLLCMFVICVVYRHSVVAFETTLWRYTNDDNERASELFLINHSFIYCSGNIFSHIGFDCCATQNMTRDHSYWPVERLVFGN